MAETTGHQKVRRAPNGPNSVRTGDRNSGKISSLSVAERVESIVGCKWSMAVMTAIRNGVHRPGALERACKGISPKVLNERLRKLTRFEIVERQIFPDVPPRVEYHFTEIGRQFVTIIDAVADLQQRLDGE